MALQLIDSFTIDNASGTPTLQLCMGDITNMSSADAVNFLVVSALPGDYTPTPGSLIGALSQAGVSVQQLSQNKAATYEPKMPCWISGPVPTNPSIQFSRILLFEPASPAQSATGLVWTIFQALNCFQGNNVNTTVALPMVCTGSGGTSFQAIMQALFYAATYAGSLAAYPMPVIKLVVYNSSQLSLVQPVFSALKGTYQGLVGLNLENNYQLYASQAWTDVQGMNLPAGLSKRQAFALRVYTTNYYKTINEVLRRPTDPNYAPMMPLFSAIDSGLSNLPAAPEGPTWRGEDNMTRERIDQYSEGAYIKLLAYTSSQRPPGSWYNGKNYQFTIIGLTLRNVIFVSESPSENEYLFPRNIIIAVNNKYCPDSTACTFAITETYVNNCSATIEDAVPAATTEIF
ncbi:hypothetical protein HB364_29280 [Pseudoflavitalea sp. X16]|uniref:ADP-ribosyltransferase n=1 Tax=Paraflavitalea devenefica TaxID=2716334 RepID=UPI0014204510|nr:ADP-ribosyltransferase [Paraflavitalea devenefica]NII29208.1 hypothetical protein [Paraflavitalea devenefica]